MLYQRLSHRTPACITCTNKQYFHLRPSALNLSTSTIPRKRTLVRINKTILCFFFKSSVSYYLFSVRLFSQRLRLGLLVQRRDCCFDAQSISCDISYGSGNTLRFPRARD